MPNNYFYLHKIKCLLFKTLLLGFAAPNSSRPMKRTFFMQGLCSLPLDKLDSLGLHEQSTLTLLHIV